MVDIAGLDKAKVLKALWDGSHEQGFSFLELPKSGKVTLEDCEKAIAKYSQSSSGLYFDYWMGHVLKVDLEDDKFDPWKYDRDCGRGAAQRAIDKLRNEENSLNEN